MNCVKCCLRGRTILWICYWWPSRWAASCWWRGCCAANAAVPMKTIGGWVIIFAAGLMVLERLGVSGRVLWTAITGFAAVAAVAFFAAWSVLSNIFCASLIFATQPFRVGDELEILDAADKVGMHGRVVAIHLLYTVLEEMGREDGRETLIQVPNSAFFQKTIRRWQQGDGEPSI